MWGKKKSAAFPASRQRDYVGHIRGWIRHMRLEGASLTSGHPASESTAWLAPLRKSRLHAADVRLDNASLSAGLPGFGGGRPAGAAARVSPRRGA